MEKIYRTVIIDDEESAIDNLCFELQRYTYISIEGKARNGVLGMKLIEKIRPDLVFLDVELPDMRGMDMVAKLKGYVSWNMSVIFYTAHDKYVIDALRAKAFDFLLKPVDSDELDSTCTFVQARIRHSGLYSAGTGRCREAFCRNNANGRFTLSSYF